MEIYKDFKDGYQVSNYGNVKNPSGGVLNLKITKAGYHSFKIKKKEFLVHRVVLEIFNPIENMKEKWVKRLDRNKLNNKIENLIWVDKPLPVIKVKKERKDFKPTFYIPKEDERFLPVVGYEEHYIISNLGNIVEINSNKKLYKGFHKKDQYVTCSLYKNKIRKTVKVAKEVLKAFNFKRNDNYFTVHYLDGNPKNINIENLQWKIVDTRPVKNTEIELQDLELLEGEIFVDCYGLPNYQVSNKGRLIHKYNRLVRKLKTSTDGYKECTFNLNGKTPSFKIHRLVLMSFNPIEGMENMYVNHINHIRDDNRLENLEWVTKSENMQKTKRSLKRKEMERLGIKKQKDGTFKINLKLHNFETKEEAFEFLTNAKKILNIN